MRSPVPEIKDHPKNQPHNQPQPGATRKAQHQQQLIPIPKMGTTGTSGVLKARGKSGLRTRKIQTPSETIAKASSVPMEVSWLLVSP